MPQSPDDRAFFGHPRGLSTLFFTEMWERFSYYGMRAILTLFMVAPIAAGGLGFDDEKAGIVYGVYTAMVYLLTLPGGWIADRFLGQRKAVLWGGIAIMTGHILLAIPKEGTFFAGLMFVMVGTGLLKPNVSAMVGKLYSEKDHRRDAGFSIFYMGINLGAFLAPLACGYLAQGEGFRATLKGWGIDPSHAWHFGFAMAAVGMFFGLLQYLLMGRNLGDAGLKPVPPESPAVAAKNKKILIAVLVAVFGIPAFFGALGAAGVITITAKLIGDSLLWLLLGTSLIFFTMLFMIGKWTAPEQRRLVVIVVLFVAALIFWTCFEQAGSTFSLFAERNTSNYVFGFKFPASFFQSANSLFVIILAPVFAWLWVKLGKREPASPMKFAIGLLLVGLGIVVMIFAAKLAAGGDRVSPLWLLSLYFIHTCGELCLSPVGLSSMTKLAPQRIGGMVMGIWFLAAAIGNYMSGRTAGLAANLSLPTVLTVLAAVTIGCSLVMFFLAKPMARMMGDDASKSSAH